jgi:hypothetical protein
LPEELLIAALPQRARAIKRVVTPLQECHRAHGASNGRLKVVADFASLVSIVEELVA